MKPTIGLMMVVRNEKNRIKECLDWHVPYVDSVVICDQESDDGTWEELELYRDSFYSSHDLTYNFMLTRDKKWGFCEPSKQKTADLLNTDWLLYVDPDEKMPRLFLESMHEMVETMQYDGFIFPRYNFFDVAVFDNNVPIKPKVIRVQHPAKDPQLRLTRKSASTFPEFLHHRVRINDSEGKKRAFITLYPIEHIKTIRDQWDDNRRYKIINHKEVTK